MHLQIYPSLDPFSHPVVPLLWYDKNPESVDADVDDDGSISTVNLLEMARLLCVMVRLAHRSA